MICAQLNLPRPPAQMDLRRNLGRQKLNQQGGINIVAIMSSTKVVHTLKKLSLLLHVHLVQYFPYLSQSIHCFTKFALLVTSKTSGARREEE